MSAFTVSDKQVSAILQGVYGKTHGGANIWSSQDDPKAYHFVLGALETWQEEADILMAENCRSVNWRYRNSHHVDYEVFVGHVKLDLKAEALSPLQVLKLIDCLAYQSCETDDWETTEAFKLLNRYRGMMVCKLPGYDDVKWSI
jgi:hypothetical protein